MFLTTTTQGVTLATLAALFAAPAVSAADLPDLDRSKLSKVHWQRKAFEAGAWPAEFPEASRRLIGIWQSWAHEMGYRMDLDPDCRVLTLSMGRFNRSVRREDALIEETLELFDSWLPPVEIEAAAAAGDELPALDAHDPPVVLLRLHDRADYLSALEFIASESPYLREWAAGAGEDPGFLLREPLCAAWIERGLDVEEWRPENELVNRLGTCLTLARFGNQPHWLEQGIAWTIELEVKGSIYSFPRRTGFVAIDEHGGWESDLKRFWGKRADALLEIEDLGSWQRGTFDELSAGMAWGMVQFMHQYRTGSLSGILRDLGRFHASQGRVTHPDGNWETIPDYETPISVQQRVFERHSGADTLRDCTRFFQTGRRYKPGK